MYKLIVLLCFPILLFSQQQRIEGTVSNAEQKKLSFVTVEVYDSQNKLVKTLNTDTNGIFILEGISANPIKIRVKNSEYKYFEKSFDTEKQQIIDIVLKSNHKDIEEVTVTKKKPLVKRKVDRLEFNVENSNISSLNAWEILKKTPNVAINNDVLSVKGSTGILVTINDKKIMLTGDELKNLLENTQGDEVKSVEVITNPPAKYEAQGSAVLNIVMKKNKIEGYRGVISSKY
ncbi:MAG: TonB-dependent receptor, partial [Chryseobacterium sp.]